MLAPVVIIVIAFLLLPPHLNVPQQANLVDGPQKYALSPFPDFQRLLEQFFGSSEVSLAPVLNHSLNYDFTQEDLSAEFTLMPNS